MESLLPLLFPFLASISRCAETYDVVIIIIIIIFISDTIIIVRVITNRVRLGAVQGFEPLTCTVEDFFVMK